MLDDDGKGVNHERHAELTTADELAAGAEDVGPGDGFNHLGCGVLDDERCGVALRVGPSESVSEAI